jgi:hypothetical protein
MLAYPTSLPVDSLDDLISNLENVTLLTNASSVCLDAWNLIGYGLSISIGSPPVPPPTKAKVVAPCSHADGIAAMKTLKAGGVITVDWMAIIQWLEGIISALLQGVLPAGM